MLVAPSRIVTLPVGVPDGAETVAVNVTAWPTADGFTDDVRVMALGAYSNSTAPMSHVPPTGCGRGTSRWSTLPAAAHAALSPAPTTGEPVTGYMVWVFPPLSLSSRSLASRGKELFP